MYNLKHNGGMIKMWIRPSIGLFFGFAAGNKDENDGNKNGNGSVVSGNLPIQLGVLSGGTVGFGEKWGLYTGLQSGIGIIPWLGINFIGVPVGIHFKKKFGLGLIIPIWLTEWYIGLGAGIGLYFLAKHLAKTYK